MGSHKILIVDDVKSNVVLLEKILANQNLQIYTALSGQEAIKLADENEFSLALLDIVMPDLDGFQTAERLRKTPLNNELPIVFLSAFLKEQEDIVKGFESGGFDYVAKPYSAALLINKVKVFCKLFEQRKRLSCQNDELIKQNKELETEYETSKKLQLELQKHQEDLEKIIEKRTEELQISRRVAEEATEAKSEFLASISHELRTPLHQIIGYTKIGIDRIQKDSREKLQGYFEEVFASSQRMFILQNNLLDLSKLESNEVIFDFQEVAVDALFQEVIQEFEKRSVDEQVDVEYRIGEGIQTIILDKNKFKQVLRNLLSNAFDFNDPGGKIEICAESEKDVILVSVLDTGIGIPEKDLIQIFDKFGKSSNPRSLTSGAGLGLFVSNMIVTGHKGKIWAENNPERGSIIKIVLPKSQVKRKKMIGQLLVENGFITKEQLAEMLEKQYSVLP